MAKFKALTGSAVKG